MVAAVETIAYRQAGGVPWHGLGVPVDNNMTVEAMLKAAGLDWTVSKRPLYFQKRGADGNLSVDLRIAPEEFALIRDSNEMMLDTVGANYKPVQNAEVLDFFKRFVEAGDMELETAGSLRGGKFIWALARLNEGFTLGKKDETRGYMLLSQPHQFGFSLTAALTPIRVVCWNTISYALGSKLDGEGGQNTAAFRMVHSREFNDKVKAEAETALGLAQSGMKAFGHSAEFLSQARAKDDDVTEYFYNVLRIEKPEDDTEQAQLEAEEKERRGIRRLREALLTAPGQDLFKGTWWNTYNAVSFVVDHEIGRTQDSRLFSAWYGQGANTKRRAMSMAIDYAEAA